MYVQGILITQEQIDAAIARMKATEYFRVDQTTEAMRKCGAKYDTAYRAALRLNQRERKAGNIMPVNRSGLWKWIGSSDNGTCSGERK